MTMTRARRSARAWRRPRARLPRSKQVSASLVSRYVGPRGSDHVPTCTHLSQVYDLETGKAVNTPKSYGKSIKPSDLPDGIARFFPIAPDTLPEPAPPSAEGGDPAPSQGTGLPADLLLPVLESLKQDIAEIRAALAQVHMRMVGGSILVIYEADWQRARDGVKWLEEHAQDEDDDEEEEDEDEDGEKRVGPPYLVKLIDFAHTKIVPGIGPDEGVLKGVDTVLSLLDGRIEQVKAAVKKDG